MSIRKYLDASSEGLPTLLRVLHVLLQGIANNALDYDTATTARFRSSIDQIAKSFDESQSKSEIFHLSGVAVKAIEDYNQYAIAHLEKNQAEFAKLVALLVDTLLLLAPTTAENTARLKKLEEMIARVRDAPDIAEVRVRLSDSLEEIRNSVNRQQTTANKAAQPTRSEQVSPPAPSVRVDTLTRLRDRQAAETALTQTAGSGKGAFAAILMIDHLPVYNMRYGRQVGDAILLHFVEYVREALTPRDQLFRWSGPTLVALLDRTSNLDDIRSEIKRIAERVPKFSVEDQTRSAVLSMPARSTVFPISAPVPILIKKLDMFTTIHSSSGANPE